MDDIQILEAVERYISGQMTPDERVYFEQLRKKNQEVDQLVVEHTFFLQQMNRFDERRKFRNILGETHIHLGEKGLIRSPRLKGKARVAYLYNRYKRVAAIAASIAGITAITISALVLSVSPVKPANHSEVVGLKRNLEQVGKEVEQIKQENRVLNKKIEDVKDQNVPVIEYKSGGTGFLVDLQGLVITNAHVVENANHIAVQAVDGPDLRADVIYTNAKMDIAILKIMDKRFKSPSSLPYSIKKTGGELAEPVFTLGYPRNDIVYGDGYIAARTGYKGDTLACQIAVPANRGNSGSPVLNKQGEIVGIINNKQTTAEGAVFAIHSKYIYKALSDLQKQDTAYKNLKLPVASATKGLDRVHQVKKITEAVYMVKVD